MATWIGFGRSHMRDFLLEVDIGELAGGSLGFIWSAGTIELHKLRQSPSILESNRLLLEHYNVSINTAMLEDEALPSPSHPY